jgi:hypothetical protein
MFGRKIPKSAAEPSTKSATPAESDRITSYRVNQDAAPQATGAPKTTSYVNAMQFNSRGYETIN